MRRFAWGALAALATASVPAWPITLVKGGEPQAAIIISRAAMDSVALRPAIGKSGSPPAKIHLAAEELQRYVFKISGALLPIFSDDAVVPTTLRARVLVGASGAFSQDLGSGTRQESLIIQARGDTLVLAGNDEGPYQGTFFAVAEFLGRLGVRWFMPGDFGEDVPRSASVVFPDLELRDKPAFIVRSWNGNIAPELRDEEALWRLRNKLSLDPEGILALPTDASLRQYMPDKDLAAIHPEYFAKRRDGSPDIYFPNLGNTDVAVLIAEKVKARIRRERTANPAFNSLGVAPDDGRPNDLRDEAMAASLGFSDLLGRDGVVEERSISEEWFRFMNRVTEEVVREFPGFIVTTNGYSNRSVPPEGVTLHPNLGIMFAAIWADLLHPYDDPRSWQQQVLGDLLRRWTSMSPRVFLYGYNHPMLVNALAPMPLPHKIAKDARLASRLGLVGFEDEQTFSWMSLGILSFYLRAQVYWNPDADVDGIVDDYYRRWYGPAASPAQAFWDALEKALEDTRLLGHEDRILPYVYSSELLRTLERRVEAAEAVAIGEPYKTRVAVDRHILQHLKAYYSMHWSEVRGQFELATREADRMFAERAALRRVSPFFYVPETRDPQRKYFSGSFYWNLTDRREQDVRIAGMIGGISGDLVALAPRRLAFAIDPVDIGRYGRWYAPDFDRSRWHRIDTGIPFYLQDPAWMNQAGVPYIGSMWYVFEVDLPAGSPERSIHLFAPTVACEAWVWTNGEFSGHREYREAYVRPATLDLDVTRQLHPGHNVIGVRVSTSTNRAQAAEGFLGPLLLYSPKH